MAHLASGFVSCTGSHEHKPVWKAPSSGGEPTVGDVEEALGGPGAPLAAREDTERPELHEEVRHFYKREGIVTPPPQRRLVSDWEPVRDTERPDPYSQFTSYREHLEKEPRTEHELRALSAVSVGTGDSYDPKTINNLIRLGLVELSITETGRQLLGPQGDTEQEHER